MYNNPNLKFRDGTQVTQVEDAIYLGVNLNYKMNINKEILKRQQQVIITWKKLSEFWKHGNCSTRDKINIFHAIIRAKLLYGLESAQLTTSLMQKLNTIQLKGLRQILKLDTTYINRENTNTKVISTAHTHMKRGSELLLFSEYYVKQRMKLLGHLFRQCDDELEKFTTFKADIV